MIQKIRLTRINTRLLSNTANTAERTRSTTRRLHALTTCHGGLIPERVHVHMAATAGHTAAAKPKRLHYPLRIGTDCSGIEAPVMALQLLRVPHEHIFSTEIDAHARASIRANYAPRLEYADVFSRNVRAMPDIDLYVCGFPCQSFSRINASGAQGFYQESNKGIIFFQCFEVICHKQPVVFVLENVKSLLTHDHGNTFNVIKTYLDSLANLYIIQHKVLNSKHYDGNLQNRPRVYIVGVRRDYLAARHCSGAGAAATTTATTTATASKAKAPANTYLFPPERPFADTPIASVWLADAELPPSYHALPLTEHKKKLLRELEQNSGLDLREEYVVNLNISGVGQFSAHAMKNRCPCLLANCSPFYITSKRRAMCAREALRIQGFPDWFKQVVSERQMLKQCGNSMSIAVLTALLKHLLLLLDDD
jgi:DNA-cytosine methyltransferase